MINNIVSDVGDAIAGLDDEASILTSGFGDVGMQMQLIHALRSTEAGGLTIVDNPGSRTTGAAALIHCEMTGASPMFFQISFAGARRGTSYSGGEISRVSSIRAICHAGRPEELRQALLKTVREMWVAETGTDIQDVLVATAESAAGNTMELGHILPDPSDEKGVAQTPWVCGSAGEISADRQLDESRPARRRPSQAKKTKAPRNPHLKRRQA